MENSQCEPSNANTLTPSSNRTVLQSTTLPLNTPPLFNTPRKRKTAQASPVNKTALLNPRQPWPRISQRISSEMLEDATKQIFGYSPRPWQTRLTEKILEGHDAIGIAGTGSGKSLVFAMLAIAAELANFKGIVIVICPLKSLQKDQVRRFDSTRTITLRGMEREIALNPIAINEDNHQERDFARLESAKHRICYASPEILLRNPRFMKLFRKESFREKVIAVLVDEAHVIRDWKDEFRKDYGELETLRTIIGSGMLRPPDES